MNTNTEKIARKSETATHIIYDYGTGITYIPKSMFEPKEEYREEDF